MEPHDIKLHQKWRAALVTEIADIIIDPAQSADFEAAVGRAVPLFRSARGCRGMRLERVVEQEGCYLLVIQWDSIEDHMDHFRRSDAFQQWRALAGPYFAEAPRVRHVEPIVVGF